MLTAVAFSWKDRIEDLQKMAAEKLTARQMAERLGVTRNAVIGACSRFGVQLGNPSHVSRCGGRKRADRKRPQRVAGAVIAPIRARSSAPPVPIKLDLEPVTELPFLCVELIDLKESSCRYPHGDDHITFCGQARDGGSSYCAFHHRVVWRVPRQEIQTNQAA